MLQNHAGCDHMQSEGFCGRVDSAEDEGQREFRECPGEILTGAAGTSWHIEVALAGT